MRRVPMTPEGFRQLEVELAYIREVARPKVVQDIEEARAHGDLSENSEYDDAKHRQGLIEGRFLEVKGKIAAAEIIDITKIEASDRVIFGVTVEIEDVDTEAVSSYRIVGTDEADIKSGLISVTSPIARALIGKEEGDEVEVDTPGGKRTLVINEVMYK